MKIMTAGMLLAVVLVCANVGWSETAATTRPAVQAVAAEQMLDQMLRPRGGAAKPLQPVSDPAAVDKISGAGSLAPSAAAVHLKREGDLVPHRIGRLTRSGDGQQWEFTFESDGKALLDPPMIILPNLKLMLMEDAIKNSSRDLRFRVTGVVTEYRGRNYLLLEKVEVVPDSTQVLN